MSKGMEQVRLWRCPIHGYMEAPRIFREFRKDRGDDHDSEPQFVCPVNLTTDKSGITDDVCDREVTGPYQAAVVPAPPDKRENAREWWVLALEGKASMRAADVESYETIWKPFIERQKGGA